VRHTGALRCRSSEICSFTDGAACLPPALTGLEVKRMPCSHGVLKDLGLKYICEHRPWQHDPTRHPTALSSVFMRLSGTPTWHGPRPAHNKCACRGKGAGHTHALRFHALGVSIHSRTVALSCCSLCVRARGVSRIVCVCVSA
jgi:hypothetical protein